MGVSLRACYKEVMTTNPYDDLILETGIRTLRKLLKRQPNEPGAGADGEIA